MTRILALMLVVFALAIRPAAAQQELVGERLWIVGEANFSGDVGHPDYVSQLNRWLIGPDGSADFRYLYTDQLRAKLFTADLESVLAGSERVTKSYGLLSQPFTCPVGSNTSTLWLKDPPTYGDAAAMQSGDAVIIRTQTRTTFGPFEIADCVGVVTSYADGTGANAGQQSWTFTRNAGLNGGLMTTGTVVPVEEVAQDMGVTGNGYVETTAVDGLDSVNAPYTQVVTWTTAPVSGNLTVRARLGNLRGITGVSNEYGLIAGDYSGNQFFRASNTAVQLVGVNLSMYSGVTEVMKMDRTAPSFAIGATVPTGYATGTGIWMGNDSGTYKFRVGNPAGQQITWDGSSLTITGTFSATSGTVGGWAIGSDAITATSGTVGMSSAVTGGDDVRFFAGNATPTSAPFRVTEAGALVATNATITGAITATSGSFTGNGSGITSINGGNITTDTITATQIAANAVNTSELNADAVTSAKIAAGTIVASDISAGSITADRLSVATLSAITANLGTITAGHIDGATADFGGTVALNSSGITIDSGTSSPNIIKWTDGTQLMSDTDTLFVNASDGIIMASASGVSAAGTIHIINGSLYPDQPTMDLGRSGDRWDQLWAIRIDTTGNIETDADVLVGTNLYLSNLAGSGRRYLCVENNGAITADTTAC